MSLYSPVVRRYLITSFNSPADCPYNATCSFTYISKCPTNNKRRISAKVEVNLLIEENKISKARIKVFGPPIAIAAGNWAAENVVGLSLEEARHFLTPSRLAAALGEPEARIKAESCVALAKTFVDALDQYSLN